MIRLALLSVCLGLSNFVFSNELDNNSFQTCGENKYWVNESVLRDCLVQYYDKPKVDYLLSKANFEVWKNKERAEELLVSALMKEQEDALVYYGILLYRGKYFEQDKELALVFFDKAHQKESLWATQTLGMIYLYDKQPSLAEKYLLEAFEKEKSIAGMFLGMLWMASDNVQKSFQFYKASFESGNLLSYIMFASNVLDKDAVCIMNKPKLDDIISELNSGLNNNTHLKTTSIILDKFQAILDLSPEEILQSVGNETYLQGLVEEINTRYNNENKACSKDSPVTKGESKK